MGLERDSLHFLSNIAGKPSGPPAMVDKARGRPHCVSYAWVEVYSWFYASVRVSLLVYVITWFIITSHQWSSDVDRLTECKNTS